MLVTGVAFLFLGLLGVVGAEPGTDNANSCKEPGTDDTTLCNESATNSPAMLQKSVGVHQHAHHDDGEEENAGCENKLRVTVRSFYLRVWPWDPEHKLDGENVSIQLVIPAYNISWPYLNTDINIIVAEEMKTLSMNQEIGLKIGSEYNAANGLTFRADKCCPKRDFGFVQMRSTLFSSAAGFEGKIDMWKGPVTLNLTIMLNLFPIKVKVRRATNLPSKDFWGAKSDPFVRISSGCDEAETRHVTDDHNPVWDQSFNLQWKVGSSLKFQVFDRDSWTKSDKIGEVLLQADEFNFFGVTGKKLKLPGSDALLEVDVTLL